MVWFRSRVSRSFHFDPRVDKMAASVYISLVDKMAASASEDGAALPTTQRTAVVRQLVLSWKGQYIGILKHHFERYVNPGHPGLACSFVDSVIPDKRKLSLMAIILP